MLNVECFLAMNIVTNIREWRTIQRSLIGKSIGFVPTMGNLHAGHLSLCEQSLANNDVTVVSIFVNPTQFNQAQDFDLYPRTLEQDTNLLTQQGVDYVFAPSAAEMYPDHYQVKVTETELSQELEGEFRPGHADGVLTVLIKFFNIIRPNRVYLGKKDYQQYLLVKKMVDALFLPIEVIPCETLRAEDGLALSSRNSRLTPSQRELAAHLPRLMQTLTCTQEVTQQLTALGFKVEYVVDVGGRRLAAVWLDQVRLIDNILL